MADENDRTKRWPAKTSRVSKTYQGAPGEYSGNIGGSEGRIKVPDSGTFETSDPDEQAFLESVVGWTPTKVEEKSTASSGSKSAKE